MAKTNAERQAEYKASRKQLNFHVSPLAYQALTDAAAEIGKTKLETLENLLLSNNAASNKQLEELQILNENLNRDIFSVNAKNEALEREVEKLKAIPKAEPQQTYAFSEEDLQEQARLIGRLTTENARLSAELQLARKVKPYHQAFADNKRLVELEKENSNLKTELQLAKKTESDSDVDLSKVDKIELFNFLQKLEKKHSSQCDCKTSKGQQCKNEGEKELIANYSINLCRIHKRKASYF